MSFDMVGPHSRLIQSHVSRHKTGPPFAYMLYRCFFIVVIVMIIIPLLLPVISLPKSMNYDQDFREGNFCVGPDYDVDVVLTTFVRPTMIITVKIFFVHEWILIKLCRLRET